MSPLLQAEDLGLSRDGRRVLDGTTFSLAMGETCALLGPSGSGKTTLLRLLAGLEAPDRGRLRLNGRDASLPGRVIVLPKDRDLGWAPQGDALWPHMSAFENAAFPLRARGVGEAETRERAFAALRAVGAETLAGRRPAELSGGQRKRVALARAIVHRPSLLLLDEPFSGLDRPARDEMLEVTLRLVHGGGASAILVTHDRDEARACSGRWLIMEEGRLVQDAPAEEIFRSPATPGVRRLLGLGGARQGAR
jgi:iron(III) transport system ATP-binding protein